MIKRFQWLFLAAALLPFVPSVAQDESIVTLAGNAYVTATSEGGDSKNVYIDEHNCALRNWDSTDDVVSFYFKAEKSGKMNVALKAKGHSKIEVSLLGKKKKIFLATIFKKACILCLISQPQELDTTHRLNQESRKLI